MRDSFRSRFPFNVIQSTTGAKADIVPLPDDIFSRIAFSRRQKMVYYPAGDEDYFISANDIVLAKLLAFRQTGSDKHLRDVKGILVTQWEHLDFELIRKMVEQNNLSVQFEQVYQLAQREVAD
jgi:hypothetical protein